MDNPRREFSKIYDKNIEKIYRFIFLKVSSVEVAEDLASETFLRGWEAYEKSKDPEIDFEEIENPQAFLYRVARNLITDHYRQKGKAQMVSVDDVPLADPQEDIEKNSELESDMSNVHFALADLKDDYQNVIIWHYLEDLPIKEVANLLDKSEENTRVLLHRALKSLKKNLKS